MWTLRALTGPKPGQIFPLKPGTNVVGRAPHCEVKLPSAGVSKEHAKIDVLGDKMILTDLESRNGTFVNGVQIRSQRVQHGDKVAFHELIFEVYHLNEQQIIQLNRYRQQRQQSQQAYSPPPGAAVHGSVAYNLDSAMPSPNDSPKPRLELQAWIQNYMQTVVLPGIYKLPELIDFHYVLLGFMAAFILFTTSLSSIPLMTILKSSIQKESQRRALTIARTLAQINRPALMQGLESSLSIEIAAREPGVEKAFIISHVDGNILAPSSLAGTYPDIPFVHEARRVGKEAVEQINSSRIGALVPIEFYNPNTGANQVAAYAVIFYDMGTLAVDDGRTLSLFIQTFFIALLIGGMLFYFMYKIIEHPIVDINSQLDSALREGSNQIQTLYQFPALQQLASNINSALHRVGAGSSSNGPSVMERDRHSEMSSLVELMGFAAFAVSAHDLVIAAVNQAFEQRVNLSAAEIVHSSVEKITDQALKLSIRDLIDRLNQTPEQLATNELEFAGQNFQIAGQAIYGSQRVAYFLFVIIPADMGGGG